MPGRCACTVQFTEKTLQKRLTKGGAAGIITHVAGHKLNMWGISSAGRALAWHARGQRFDPAILHQKSTILHVKYGAFLFAEADFWDCIASPAPFLGFCRRFLYNPQLLTLHRFQKGMFAARFLAGCCIIPFNVRRKVEVEGNVERIPTINIYSADKLIDNHFLCFKTGTVVQVSIGNQLIIQVPVVMRFFNRSAFLQTVPYMPCAV